MDLEWMEIKPYTSYYSSLVPHYESKVTVINLEQS